MYNIKMLNKIAGVGINQLEADLFACAEDIEAPDGILVRSADMHNMELGRNLRCIARAGAGTNNIPIDRCSEAGVVVFNTPGANANAVCESVICALLLSSRDIVGGVEWAKSLVGKGDEVPSLVEKGKSAFVGPEILGKSIGIVGLGAIGVMVANAAQGLGLKVTGYDPYISVDSAWGLSRNVHRARDLSELFATSDYITLHMPMTKETAGTINSAAIASMRDGVRILNFARGELVNNADMLAALESGKVARYVTDFPNEELLRAKNVIAVPHLGASTPESEDNCAVMAVAQLRDFLLNGNVKNSVNFPNVFMERTGLSRLCMLHRNIPNMLGSITSLLAEEHVNIENLVNKSKKDNAYTLIDLNTKVKTQTLDKLRAIDGMLRLRIIMDAEPQQMPEQQQYDD